MKDKIREAFDQIPIPPAWKATMALQGFGLKSIPLLFSVRPKVRKLTEQRAEVEVPLNRWTRNHLGSMYFGTLAIGADCVVGMLAVHQIDRRKAKVHLSFKDFHADFLKRPEGNVIFVCEEGEEISRFVDEILRSGERNSLPVHAWAHVKGKPEEPVARFTLTLSLKRKP